MKPVTSPFRRLVEQKKALVALPLALALLLAVFLLAEGSVVHADPGDLDVQIIAGYNLVVDSNVSSPSTYAPRAATVIGKFCNTSTTTDLTNVYGRIGDGTTPGTYPVYDSNTQTTYPYLNGTGDYSFRHVGGAADASRYIGTIPAGECRYQYWSFEYPACENVWNSGSWEWKEPPCSGDPVWGTSVKPEDDLALQFKIWAHSDQGDATAEWTMTMRNEISAMANKIEPNGNPAGRWFNTDSDTVNVGDVITSNGILYSLGNVRFGFDNDVDYVPDYNAWVQPISQADFDPSCFRLIRTSGVLTVTRGGGNPPLIRPFEDTLYFTDLPPDNTNVRGEVYYTFLALDGPCSVGLSPYQEVASGYDNEKFNGDYGTGIPPVVSEAPNVTIAKSSTPDTVALGDTTTYQIPFANSGTKSAGLTLASGYGMEMPLVISDTVPDGLQYVGGSATYSLSGGGSAIIRYSTDSGATWTTTDPGTTFSTWPNNRVIIQWRLDQPLPAGSTANYAQFEAQVPDGSTPPAYSGTPFIENTACVGLGDASPFGCATALTFVEGTGAIGDFVWRDENNNGQQDDGATGIDGVTVSLYWDRNGDGALDDDDALLRTQDTTTYGGNPGYYQFTYLPAGDFLVVADRDDVQASYPGYRATTSTPHAVTLTSGASYQAADFGYGPSLAGEKRILPSSETCGGYEGREVVYSLSLSNERPGTGETVGGGCRYPIWSTTGSTASPPKNFTNDYYAYGEPDDNYAYGNFAIGSNRWIEGTGFDPGSASGAINTVEAVFRLYLDVPLADDFVTARLYQSTTELGNANFATAELNSHVGQANAGYLVWDITSSLTPPGGSWSWDDFALLTLHLEPQKNGGADASVIYLDAMGFRVTTSDPCPAIDENDIMTTVPLTDTYDTTHLQFISADPPQTAIVTTTGVITWTNVGPIYPGETRNVYVRFLALNIGASSITVDNQAGSTATRFADGGYANNVHDAASGSICPTGSINGYVYSDPNSSGWNYNPSGGDLAIPGVRVTLYGCYNTVSGELITVASAKNAQCTDSQNSGEWRVRATQVTDADGYYAFDGLLDGFFYAQVASGDLPGTVSQTAEANDNQSATGTPPDTTANGHACLTCDSTWGDPIAKLTTGNFNPINNPGETINGVNFGYNIQPGAYGSVWEDNNGDGDKDSGEGPIGSVTVQLYTGSCGGSLVTSTTTDTAGRYQFGSLTAATTYYIVVDTSSLPGGSGAWSQTGESDDSIDNCISFTAMAGTLSGSHDFGFRNTGSYTIGDTLYYDWNGDGTPQPSSEEGIPNITVSLYEDSNGNGVVDSGEDALIATTTTSSSGFYQFANLPADNYLVIVDTTDPDFPAAVVQTQDPDEGGVCVTCNSNGKANISSSSIDTVDFGYQPKGVGTIGDTVWRDMNGDGSQAGPTETGIANITVWLEVDLNNDGTFARVATAATDADGQYLFSNLPDAKYRVVVDSSDTDLPTDAYGHLYAPSTATTTGAITISDGSTYLDADFGFAPGGAIGDRIWRDDNGNGNQDESEPGISGVTVGLYAWTDVDGDGVYDASVDTLSSIPLLTDVTDSDGLYLFSGLAAGNYVVQVDDGIPFSFTQSGDPDWLEPCTGSGLCDGASGDTLRTGQIDLSRDFGYIPPGVIGDTLWIDADGDGVQDSGEAGIPYITVELSDATCTVGSDCPTTETDSDGYYYFGGLDTNNHAYTVIVHDYEHASPDPDFPSGLALTYDPDEANPCSTCDSQGSTTLTAGSPDDLTLDFGYRYNGPYDISGTVFFDDDNDGNIYTPANGDVPYEGITVYLWNSSGLLIATTTTDSNGDYTFGNLPNGNYTVSMNPDSPKLTGMTMTYEPDGGGTDAYCGTTSDPVSCNNYATPVTINNASVSDQDFGFYASIDFGDLPDGSYGTKLSSEGPRHTVGSLCLGSSADAEGDGQPTADATGDDSDGNNDDDGVSPQSGSSWTAGGSVTLHVTVTGSGGYLVGFFDWNDDGDLNDAGERVIYGNVTLDSFDWSVGVPGSATLGGWVYARFRLYDGKPLSTDPTGLAYNGEVEDYRWSTQPTAVTLVNFTASPDGNAVLLAWETASEIDTLGFNLYRAESLDGQQTQLNGELIQGQAPGSPVGATYHFVDDLVQPGGTYYYWLQALDVRGDSSQYGPVLVEMPAGSPARYRQFLPTIQK